MMIPPGHTLLTDLSDDLLPQELLVLLKSCWIETVEEFLAILSVLKCSEQKSKPGLFPKMCAIEKKLSMAFPQEFCDFWKNASNQPAYSLGVECPQDQLEQCLRDASLRNPTSIAPLSQKWLLPSSCLLADQLLPVRDQGSNGTCVAYSIAALAEYLTKSKKPLSTDCLYYCCKQFDGFHGIEGTTLQTAFRAVNQFGICTEEYFNSCDETTLFDQEAILAESRKYRIDTRFVFAGVIDDYKTVLSGADGSSPMPIVAGFVVFDSWGCSKAAEMTGKVTLPLAGEIPNSSIHAMLIVGYQDDPSVPGGGYFIVRNSWGEDWASMSSIGLPGHALIPYEYVQRFVTEAYTGPSLPNDSTCATSENDESSEWFKKNFIVSPPQNARDEWGNLVPNGTKIIALCDCQGKPQPDTQGHFFCDTEKNRISFINNGFGWTDSQRTGNYYPTSNALTQDFVKISPLRDSFIGAIDTNVMGCVRKPFPFKTQRSLFNQILSRTPKINKVTQVQDLTDSLIELVSHTGNIPVSVPLPEEWRKKLKEVNAFRVYRVECGSIVFHVSSVFVTPVHFRLFREPILFQANTVSIHEITKVYDQWREKSLDNPLFHFMTIGTAGKWFSCKGESSSRFWRTISSYLEEENDWETHNPPNYSTEPAFRDFVCLLSPLTEKQRLDKVVRTIQSMQNESFPGHIRTVDVSLRIKLDTEEVNRCFKSLAATGKYQTKLLNDGNWAIEKIV